MRKQQNRGPPGPGVRWAAEPANPSSDVTVCRDRPVVVKVSRGGDAGESARARRKLINDQFRRADMLANTLDQMEAATREIRKVTAGASGDAGTAPRGTRPRAPNKKEPFYPAPNLTHKPRAKTSVRQGAARSTMGGVNQVVEGFGAAAAAGAFGGAAAGGRYDGSNNCTREDRQAWQYVDVIPADLNDELTDFSAKVQHYESRVDDLNKTVDELQDQLDVEREVAIEAEAEARHVRAQQTEVEQRVADRLAEELAARGFPPPPPAALLPPGLPFPYYAGAFPPPPFTFPVPPIVPPVGPADGPAYWRYLAGLAPRYARLRQLLTGITPDAVAASRDLAISIVAELEEMNARLHRELKHRDEEVATLEARDRKAADLQTAFDRLRSQSREAKDAMRSQLEEQRRQLARKDEEIAQLKSRSQIVVRSADDIRAATDAKVKKVKKAAAADLAVTQAALANVQADADRQKRDFKEQSKEAKRSLRAASRRIEELEGQLRDLRRASLTGDAAAEVRRQAEEERRRAEAAAEELDKERSEHARRVATLEEELRLARDSHGQLHTDHSELASELNNAQEALEEAQTVIREQKERHDALHREHTEHVTRHEETKEHLVKTKQAHDSLESRAREEIQKLQAELRKAVEVTEHLEKIREDQQRAAEAKMWDLKEKLDYANQSRRSLQNYAQHVRGAYKEVFDSAVPPGPEPV